MDRCAFIFAAVLFIAKPVFCQWGGSVPSPDIDTRLPQYRIEAKKLRGPIKSIHLETALLKSNGLGSVEQARQIDEEDEYDRVGNLTVRRTYSNGTIILTTRYVYDSRGDLTEEIGLETNESFNYRRLYRYSSQRRLVGETVCRSKLGYLEIRPPTVDSGVPPPPPLPPPKDGYCEKFRYVYDDDGNIAETVTYESNHRDPYKEAYEHDHEGNLTAVFMHYDILEDKPSLPVFAYKYDANGNLIEEAYYASGIFARQNTKPFRRELYAYDSEGRVISKSSYDSTGIREKWNYKYDFDSKGNWIKMTEYLLVKEREAASRSRVEI